MSFTNMFYLFWTFMIPIMVFIIPRGYFLYKLQECEYNLYKNNPTKKVKKPTTLSKIVAYIPFYNTWKQMEIISGKATIYKINAIFTAVLVILLPLSRIILPLVFGVNKVIGYIGVYTTFAVIIWIGLTFVLSIISGRIICDSFGGQKYKIWTWGFPPISVFNVAIHLKEYFKNHAEELGGVYDPD